MDEKINIVIFELNYINNKKVFDFIESIDKRKYSVQILVGFHKEEEKEVECLYGENIDDIINKVGIFMNKYKPDYFITLDSDSNFIVASSKKNKKTSYWYGEIELRSNHDRKIGQYSLKNRLRTSYQYNFKTSGIITLTKEMKKDLIKKYFVAPNKIKPIGNQGIVEQMKKKVSDERSLEDTPWEYINRSNVVDFIEHGGKIGTGCEVFPQVHFGSEPYLIKIGNNVRITDGVKFLTHDGGAWVLRKMKKSMEKADLFGTIVVGDNTHIGWNSIIMPNVKIGKNCIIGCGAIVTKDIPDNSIAVGVPARVIEDTNEYEKKNKHKFEFTNHLDWYQKRDIIEKKYRKKLDE